LKSAIANWETKTGMKADQETLYVSKIMVDGGMMLKRLQTAPQGRGYRIRKRSNHVTIFVDTKNTNSEK
jgi:large subunit ribosomal protein L22